MFFSETFLRGLDCGFLYREPILSVGQGRFDVILDEAESAGPGQFLCELLHLFPVVHVLVNDLSTDFDKTIEVFFYLVFRETEEVGFIDHFVDALANIGHGDFLID